MVILECKYGKGRYPKIKLSSSSLPFLRFTNGRTGVSDEDFENVVKKAPQYGKEFAQLGQLRAGVASTGPAQPKVTRGAGSTKKQGGR